MTVQLFSLRDHIFLAFTTTRTHIHHIAALPRQHNMRLTPMQSDSGRGGVITVALAVAVCFCTLTTSVAASLANQSVLVFLHPAATGKGKPVDVSPSQLHQILSHHLDVPGEALGSSAGHREAWDWLESSVTHGRQAIEDLFAEAKQRTVIMISDMDESDVKRAIPASLRQTHSISSPPSLASFASLLQAYGERIYSATPGLTQQFEGLILNAAGAIEDAAGNAAEWMFGKAAELTTAGKKTLDETDLTDEPSRPFYHSLKNLVAYLDRLDSPQLAAESKPYQAIHFQGLGQIKSTYGEDSRQFQQALEQARAVLHATVEKLDQMSPSRRQALALVVVPEGGANIADLLQKRGDILFPFRMSIGKTPFLRSREMGEEMHETGNLSKRQNASPAASSTSSSTKPSSSSSGAPKEKDFVGKCFTSEDDLNKATQNCTGHGKAVQTSKGGRKCYRCQCQVTKSSKGKQIEWAGEACQKQDISKSFVLLSVTTISLLLVSLGSVLYLYNEGETELPSVLAGITIPSK